MHKETEEAWTAIESELKGATEKHFGDNDDADEDKDTAENEEKQDQEKDELLGDDDTEDRWVLQWYCSV